MYITILTKVGILAHIPSIFIHTFPQETLRLGVAWTPHLSTDFGDCVEHGKFGSCCWVGLQVLRCFIDDIYHCFAGDVCSLMTRVREMNVLVITTCAYSNL